MCVSVCPCVTFCLYPAPLGVGPLSRRVKIVEKTGTKLSQVLSGNPWRGENCKRERCKVCQTRDEGTISCRTRSVLYLNTCGTCKEAGAKTVYIGETGRSSSERLQNHYDDRRLVSKREKSHMYQHWTQDHQDMDEVDVNWKFKIVKSYRSPLMRQISEAIRIQVYRRDVWNLLNFSHVRFCH